MIRALLNNLEKSISVGLFERRRDGSLDSCNGAQLIARCEEWSGFLRSLNIPKKSSIIIPMRSSIEAVAVLLASWEQGLLPILARPAAPIAYLQTLVQRVGASALLIDSASSRLLQLPGRLCAGSPSSRFIPFIIDDHITSTTPRYPTRGDVGILTTGTTGQPKVVVNSLANILLNASLHAQAVDLDSNDKIGLSLPLSFSYGLVAGLLAAFVAEAKVVFMDPEPADAGEIFAHHNVTVAMTTPYTSRHLLGNNALRGLRVLTVGGDVFSCTLAREIMNRAPKLSLYGTYGLSEAGPRVATCRVSHGLIDDLGAIPLGDPLAGVRLRLECTDSRSDVGELVVSSPTCMQGYLNDPAGTEAVIDPQTQELHTGDQFTTRSGEFFFAGRNKRIICRAGEKIYPALVEWQILSFGKIRDAWVTAMPHSEYGEVPQAYVIAANDVSLRDLERHLRRTLPRSHVPLSWKVVDEFPAGSRK